MSPKQELTGRFGLFLRRAVHDERLHGLQLCVEHCAGVAAENSAAV
jgi:hypothetical protein